MPHGRYKSFLKNYSNQRCIYLLAFMLMFWTLFDSTITYVTPLIITERGFSDTMMGLIYASSSVIGAFFDFFICKLFKKIQMENKSFRKIMPNAQFIVVGLLRHQGARHRIGDKAEKFVQHGIPEAFGITSIKI